MGKLWSLEDDYKLWSLRSKKTTSQLAVRFNKTAGAIRSRLRHLNDPNHKACRRLAQIVDVEIDIVDVETDNGIEPLRLY